MCQVDQNVGPHKKKIMKCKCPNLVYIDNKQPGDLGYNKRVHFVSFGSGNYSVEWAKEHFKGAIEVPCGNCAACRLDYSRTWANRCYLESLCHPFNWFITLSYRDDSLVYGSKGLATLEKDAISSFMKNLRHKFRDTPGIRFFGCGEYGDRTMRPHYHIIVFGAPLQDLTIDMPDMSKPLKNGKYPIFRRKNSNGDYVFFSQTIYDCWKKGKIEVEECSWNTSAYVSRYVMKKQKGRSSEIYNRLDILPEFLRMSNRPGIGAQWLLDNKEKLLEFDYLSVKNANGVQTTRPPRYFEKLMKKNEDSIEAALMDSNKLDRIVNAAKLFRDLQTTKTVGTQARDQSDFIEKISKLLTRDID